MPELLTIQEVADLLRVSRATVYREVGRNKIRLIKVRSSSFISRAELDRYLRASERTA